MNKLHYNLIFSAVFLLIMFTLQVIFRNDVIAILSLNFVVLGFILLIFWKILKWLDSN